MRNLLIFVFLVLCSSQVLHIDSLDVSKLVSLQQLTKELEIEQNEPSCSIDAVDMIFCLDSSGNMKSNMNNFAVAELFLANLTRALTLGQSPSQSQVGLVMFTDVGKIIFDLKDYYSSYDLFNAIASAQPLDGNNTAIANGMNMVTDFGFSSASAHGARPGIPHVMVVLTNSQDNSDVNSAQLNAAGNGIVTYAVGIGPDVSREHLNNVTGDPSKVFVASNFDVLHEVLPVLCNQIASPSSSPTTPSPTSATSTPLTSGSPGGVNSVRVCAGGETASPANIKLDIIFALDSSQAMGSINYRTFKEHMAGIVQRLTVNQNGGSRVGLIYYADLAYVWGNLTSYNSSQEAADALNQMGYMDIIKLDMKTALDAAQRMFSLEGQIGRKQVLVLSSTGCTDCKDNGRTLEATSQCGTVGPDQEDTCRLAAHMKESGITIMTVLVQLDNDGDSPPISLASPCFSNANNNNLTRNLIFGWYNVNCYCRDDHFTQFVSQNDQCQKYAECVVLQLTPDTWKDAQKTCASQGGFLADEFSDNKQIFLRDMAIRQLTPNPPYFWIGLNDQSGTYMWDRGTGSPVSAMSGDYTYWGPGQPNDANGNCFAASKKVGFQLFWENKKCDEPVNPASNLYFFCQQNACAELLSILMLIKCRTFQVMSKTSVDKHH